MKNNTIDTQSIDHDQAKSAIERVLRDRNPTSHENFTVKASKTAGTAAGYIASDTRDDSTGMLKSFHKRFLDAKTHEEQLEYRDSINEYIAGTIFPLLLYDKAPKISLVTPDSKDNYNADHNLKSAERELLEIANHTQGKNGSLKQELANLSYDHDTFLKLTKGLVIEKNISRSRA